MARRIGIDFDNTLVCYDQLFYRLAEEAGFVLPSAVHDKRSLREWLRQQEGGEIAWQKLQAQAYGPRIGEAQLFDGVWEALERCRQRGDRVFVVSHKSDYAAQENGGVHLHEAARVFLADLGLFEAQLLEPGQVFFEESRVAKVERIGQLDLDLFIDDLPETFAEEGFPSDTQQLLFAEAEAAAGQILCRSWNEIGILLEGRVDVELETFLRQQFADPDIYLSPLPGGNNSRAFRVATSGQGSLFLKLYPDDGRGRLETETRTLEFLAGQGLPVPRTYRSFPSRQCALYDWIDGKPLERRTLASNELDQLLVFLARLHDLRHEGNGFSPASEACLQPVDVIDILQRRRERFVQVEHVELQLFLQQQFDPCAAALEVDFTLQQKGLAAAPEDELTLSPSDFGAHNLMCLNDGRFFFVDFEFFGRDDPAKLISDFLWHPATSLRNEQVEHVLQFSRELYDTGFERRWQLTHRLHGLKWVLLILNEFLSDHWQRRFFAGEDVSREQRQDEQLAKAKRLFEQVQTADERMSACG